MAFPARIYLTHVSEDPSCPTSTKSGIDEVLWNSIGLALFGGADTLCWSPFADGRKFLQIGMKYNPVFMATDVRKEMPYL